MPTMPQKIRTGLVELRTNVGSVYVSPSFWERIYLLWTFRNFHSLPKQVLNRHQQQLIDKLCKAEIVSRTGPIARTSIIGAVENVYLKRDCETEKAAATGVLIEMSAASTDAAASRAVGSEGISIRSSRAAYNRTLWASPQTELQRSKHFRTQTKICRAKRSQRSGPGTGADGCR